MVAVIVFFVFAFPALFGGQPERSMGIAKISRGYWILLISGGARLNLLNILHAIGLVVATGVILMLFIGLYQFCFTEVFIAQGRRRDRRLKRRLAWIVGESGGVMVLHPEIAEWLVVSGGKATARTGGALCLTEEKLAFWSGKRLQEYLLEDVVGISENERVSDRQLTVITLSEGSEVAFLILFPQRWVEEIRSRMAPEV